MTLNDFVVSFDPFINSSENKMKLLDKRIIKFQAWIDFDDILEVSPLIIPSKKIDGLLGDNDMDLPKDHYVQIFLTSMWSKSLKSFYKDICVQMEKERIPIASIFFKICDNEENGMKVSEHERQEILSDIIQKINHFLKNRGLQKEKEVKKFSSNIPFFDILYDNIRKVMRTNTSGEETNRKIAELHLPVLQTDSSILSRKDFAQIVNYIPSIWKLRAWKLAYSSMRNGSSMCT